MPTSNLEIADLFAGGGGFSTGIAAACKQMDRNPNLLAVNHWSKAVETHKLNHPWARHLCTGLESVLPSEVCPSRLNLLSASPECNHHSNARGGKPMNDQSRSSAWLVLKWLQEIYVESVLIENVQEFEMWGPLGANGRPLVSMRGQLFTQFVNSLKALGYNVEWKVINAANLGGATTRERLFVMARRGKNKRIIWPDETHSHDADLQIDMFSQKAKWRAAREIIDWSLPSQSIFSRKKPLAPSTLERIAAGLKKFGGKNSEPFLVVLRNHMAGRSINEPLPTLTAGGNHVGLCQPFYFNMQRAQDPLLDPNRPMPTITATSNDYGLVEPFVLSMEHSRKPLTPYMIPLNHGVTAGGGHRVYDINNPMPTVTTVDAWGVVEPFVISAGGPAGQGRNARGVSEPMSTVLTDDHHALVEPFIISYYGTQNMSGVDAPLPTVTTKDRFGLVQFGDGLYLDIHFRMLSWRELSNAMGFPADYEFAGNRSDKVKQIGNAVEVNCAKALALAALAA